MIKEQDGVHQAVYFIYAFSQQRGQIENSPLLQYMGPSVILGDVHVYGK